MVEQQVLSNDLLTSLSTELGTGSLGQLAGLIGMEARSTAAVAFDGTPITVLPKVETGADEAILIAYGSDGTEKMREQIATTGQPVQWAGRQTNGTILPTDTYTYKVESRVLGEKTGTSSAQTPCAFQQRVRNRQPDGGFAGLGTSPSSTMRVRSALPAGSGTGTAERSAWVYGCAVLS